MFSLFSKNKIEMNYHAQEMDLSTKGNFTSFTEETWIIGDKYIKTPHGVLQIKNAIFVEQGALVGIQFTVKGSFNLSSVSCSKGNEGKVNIKTFAVMRQPHNAWLWCYAFDENNQPCVNFCGQDDFDGLALFYTQLKQLYK